MTKRLLLAALLATASFGAAATVKRSEFGLAMAVPMVSDQVTLRITTEARAAQ